MSSRLLTILVCGIVCCIVSATASTLHSSSPTASTQWLHGHVIGIESTSSTNSSLISVVTYDPLSGASFASQPIPQWWHNDSIAVSIDVTSARAAQWSVEEYGTPNVNSYIAFLIATNDTAGDGSGVPQALYVYQYQTLPGQYAAPQLIGSCVSRALLLTDLQFLPIHTDFVFGAAIDLVNLPEDTPFSFQIIQMPLGVGGDCQIEPIAGSQTMTPPAPYSLSDWYVSYSNGLLWSYIAMQMDNSTGTPLYTYTLESVPLPYTTLPFSIPLPYIISSSIPPPSEPWFSLQVLFNPLYDGQDDTIPVWYIVNGVTETLWSVKLLPNNVSLVEQVSQSNGASYALFTIPCAITQSIPATNTTAPVPIFLWLNDYKQLIGSSPDLPDFSIKGRLMPQLTWSQKFIFNPDPPSNTAKKSRKAKH